MIYIIISAVIFFMDYRIKNYIEKNKGYGNKEEILNGHIIIERCHNKGAMLNFMEHNKRLLLHISGIILVGVGVILITILPKKGNSLLKFALSLILGGAACNVYDRFKRGYVVDYFSFSKLKKLIFNISDIFIIVGSFIIMMLSFLDFEKH